MTTVAAGGFSTFDNSAEEVELARSKWLIIAGMLVSGLNFGLLLAAIRGGLRVATGSLMGIRRGPSVRSLDRRRVASPDDYPWIWDPLLHQRWA